MWHVKTRGTDGSEGGVRGGGNGRIAACGTATSRRRYPRRLAACSSETHFLLQRPVPLRMFDGIVTPRPCGNHCPLAASSLPFRRIKAEPFVGSID